MARHSFFVSLGALISLAALGGCADSKGLVEVTGTVKFADGSVPVSPAPGIQGNVGFHPVEPGFGNKGPKVASGTINPQDGSFELYTLREKGAYPAEYNVVITVPKEYPPKTVPPEGVVHRKYSSPDTTDIKVTVDASNHHFDLVVDKPEEKPARRKR